MNTMTHASVPETAVDLRTSEDRRKAPILVVDDSVLSQRLARGLIESGTDRSVVVAENGEQALGLLKSLEPCLVLTDIHMPVMDGFELVQAIRAEHPQIPVILMTAYGSEAIAMRALKAGAASYVPKNFLVADLVDTLRQILAVVDDHHQRRRVMSCQTARSHSFEMDPDPDLISPLVTLVQEDLVCFAIGDETTRMQVAIALRESLTNALYHGNLEVSSDLRQDDERPITGS